MRNKDRCFDMTMCVYFDGITSFPERLKIIGLDPLVRHHQVPTHQLHQVRLHTAHAQHSFLLPLHVPLAHLLATHQHETALACLQQTVVFAFVRLVLLHYQLEVAVVKQKRALFLHEEQVSEGMHEGDSDVEL